MFSTRLTFLLVSVTLFSGSLASNLGLVLTETGLNAIKSQLVRAITSTFKDVTIPDAPQASNEKGGPMISKVVVKKITLDPTDLLISLDKDMVTIVVQKMGADVDSNYFLPKVAFIMDVSGRSTLSATGVAAKFQFKLDYKATDKVFETTCVEKEISVSIKDMDLRRIPGYEGSSKFATDMVLSFNNLVKGYAESMVNKVAKTACKDIINPILRVIPLAVPFDEPVTKAKFLIDFHPAEAPLFAKNLIYFNTDLKLLDREAVVAPLDSKGQPKTVVSPTANKALPLPVTSSNEHIVVVIRQELLVPLFDYYFPPKKPVHVKIVTTGKVPQGANEPEPIVFAQVIARGLVIFEKDLTPLINGMKLMPAITMLGYPALDILLDAPPSLTISGGELRFAASVRVNAEFIKGSTILKLTNENFSFDGAVKVGFEKAKTSASLQKIPAQKNLKVEPDLKTSPQFEAVVVPQSFKLRYSNGLVDQGTQKQGGQIDSLSHFVNSFVGHFINIMEPVRLPLPVKEELAGMGLPGSPTDLSISCEKAGELRLGLQGDFDFSRVVSAFLNADPKAVDILNQGGQGKNIGKII